MNKVTYREATLDDAGNLALIYERAEAKRKGTKVSGVIQDQEDVEAYSRRLTKDGVWSRIAFIDDDIAGFILGFPTYNEAKGGYLEDTEHLQSLMVDPQFWGRGIGRSLLEWVEEYSGKAEKKHVELWTEETNERSCDLYEKNGYKKTGAKKVHESLNEPILQYQLDL